MRCILLTFWWINVDIWEVWVYLFRSLFSQFQNVTLITWPNNKQRTISSQIHTRAVICVSIHNGIHTRRLKNRGISSHTYKHTHTQHVYICCVCASMCLCSSLACVRKRGMRHAGTSIYLSIYLSIIRWWISIVLPKQSNINTRPKKYTVWQAHIPFRQCLKNLPTAFRYQYLFGFSIWVVSIVFFFYQT